MREGLALSLDGKVLRKARDRLEENKRRRQAELNRRTAEVYAKAPVIRQIDQRIRQTAAEAITAVVSGSESAEAAVERISEENLALQEDREYELVMAGFPQDYLDDGYACETCRDTGFVDGKPCRCLMELYAQEQRKELSSLLAGGNESFDNFDLMLYDDKPDPKTGINPRQQMEYVYDYCLQYAMKFGKYRYNLFLNGGPGLGKTFLSACIARVVAESGYSVVYDTAQAIFSRFETAHFSKSEEDIQEARNETHRILNCDLLIIDDLGTEYTNAFVSSRLFACVNERILKKKSTIISTNLNLSEFQNRYSERISSRIFSSYKLIRLSGSDIRIQKQMRGGD